MNEQFFSDAKKSLLSTKICFALFICKQQSLITLITFSTWRNSDQSLRCAMLFVGGAVVKSRVKWIAHWTLIRAVWVRVLRLGSLCCGESLFVATFKQQIHFRTLHSHSAFCYGRRTVYFSFNSNTSPCDNEVAAIASFCPGV